MVGELYMDEEVEGGTFMRIDVYCTYLQKT